MFPSVDWMALTPRTSLKALCLGHRVLQELLYKFSDPCSKLLKACWAFGYIILSIFRSSSIQSFGNRGGEWLSFLGNGVSGLDFTFICGWSFISSFGFWDEKMLQDLYFVSKYFIKLGIDIWHCPPPPAPKPVCGWNGKSTYWYSNIFSSLSSESTFFPLTIMFQPVSWSSSCQHLLEHKGFWNKTICQMKTTVGHFFFFYTFWIQS